MIHSVTLLGSSSGRNAGDAALISSIMDSIDEACERRIRYEIPTVKPSFIQSSYPNDAHPISMLPWHASIKMLGIPTYRSIMRTDLTLVFDAILFDRSLFNPAFNYLSTLAVLLPIAKKRGKRLGCYNVGTGPVDSKPGQRMLRDVSELMDFITVRDQQSFDLLKSLGVKNPNIRVTADAALNLKPATEARGDEILRAKGIDPHVPFLAVNINQYLDTWARPRRPSMGKERFLAVYSEALNRFQAETSTKIVLIGTQHHDVPISLDLKQRLKSDAPLVSNAEFSHYEVTRVMQRAGLLFGMRLHSVILASSVLTPVIGIAYQPKVEHYLQLLGLPESSLSFDSFSAESVYQHIKTGWERRSKIRAQLQQVIPQLQQEAKAAAMIVRDL